MEVERMKNKLQESRTSYQQLSDEHRSLQSALETKIAELSSQLKIKTFEHERLVINFEETSAALKQSNLIIEQQRKKIEVKFRGFYRLELIV
jgi:hypothetical protein